MKIDDVIKQVADELGIPHPVARLAYMSMFRFIREKMAELPLKDKLSDEEFLSLRPNFNVPSLGKFYVTLDRYKTISATIEYLREQYEKTHDIQNLQD